MARAKFSSTIRHGTLTSPAVLLMALLAGCNPVTNLLTPWSSPIGERRTMGGTRSNLAILDELPYPFCPAEGPLLSVGAPIQTYFDFPFSLVADVLLLPITVPLENHAWEHGLMMDQVIGTRPSLAPVAVPPQPPPVNPDP